MDHRLAAELAAMAAEDQQPRAMPDDGAFARRVTVEHRIEGARVQVANTDRLRELVAEVGWPGRALVGEQAAAHAWLIAQHADHQLDSVEERRSAVGLPPLKEHLAQWNGMS